MHKLSIEKHIKSVEELQSILEMIRRNRNYMLSDISDLGKKIYTYHYPKSYFENNIEFRKKIQVRLIVYYAKKLAAISSDAYTVALENLKPISSN